VEAHDRAQLEARARYRTVLLQKIKAASAVQTFWPCFMNLIRKKKEQMTVHKKQIGDVYCLCVSS
jgi:hypothetical protein